MKTPSCPLNRAGRRFYLCFLLPPIGQPKNEKARSRVARAFRRT
jgi:hypothetical protein